MSGGRLVETGPAEEVIERPSHPVTRLLLDSLLTLDAQDAREVA
ncbi:MAG: hypothetical protein LBE49_06595 [Deltaproteobacteria bacterium]|jgi:peptide/nickel transport system ATP-binding protein|nr:hypothetical protein [Deltaproteobacteria bacterium]